MTCKAVLFDLDGTLLDTLADLRDAMNRALASFGFPPHTLEEVRSFVGNGIRDYTLRAVPAGTDPETADRVLAAFKADYSVHCKDKTAPYAGILPLLEALKQSGIQTAIVSNKADFAVKALAEEYFPGLCDCALGESAEIPKKPAPDMIRKVLRTLGVSEKDALYVGDSDVDFDTAMNAGLDVILVDWGFRSRALLESRLDTIPKERSGAIASTTEELLRLIKDGIA